MTSRDLSSLELCGNALCLDFANTINSRRHSPAHDYLASVDDLQHWFHHAGAQPSDAPPSGQPVNPVTMLREAHRLRDAIYATFSAIAGHRDPMGADVGRIGDAYGRALSHATIARREGGGFELRWTTPTPEAPLWSVAISAGELLLGGDLGRIGECPGCGWLFLDTSRNGTRRWCSMATCGSRDKMARYHRRPRA